MNIADFNRGIALTALIHRGNTNRATELAAIATALGTDTTTYDTTIQAAPLALRPGVVPPAHSRFTNDCLLIVNQGKAGKLTPAAMGSAITSALGSALPPVNTTAPVIAGTATVGSTLTITPGVYTGVVTAKSYQWRRDGLAFGGLSGALTYTVSLLDSGHTLSVLEQATGPGGATPVASNGIAIA
jgi:hypothetical protein